MLGSVLINDLIINVSYEVPTDVVLVLLLEVLASVTTALIVFRTLILKCYVIALQLLIFP